MDDDMARERNLIGFATQRVAEARAVLRTPSGQMPIRLSAAGNGVLMFGVPKAANPADRDGVTADLNRATQPGGFEDFQMHLDFEAYSPARAEASWVRSAYLAFFAALGYEFVWRPELNVGRARILNADTRTHRFRIISREPFDAPHLAVIAEPRACRSFALLYGHNIVLLPMYGDNELYSRLAEQPANEVSVTAEGEYEWPRLPTFLHDLAAAQEREGTNS